MTSLTTTGSPCALPSRSPRAAAVRLVGRLEALIWISSCDKSVEHRIDEVDSRQMRLGNLSARQDLSRHQTNQFMSR